MRRAPYVVAGFFAASACGNSTPGKTVYFDLDADLTKPENFWNLPFPSDLRLDANGAPDIAGFPNPRKIPIMTTLMSIVPDRRGFPLMSTGYVRFTDTVPTHSYTDVISDNSVTLIDIDPSSPELGTQFPIVAQSLTVDAYTTSNVVAFAPRPGIVLAPLTQYAYVVRTAFAPGFSAPSAIADLAAGHGDAKVATLYASLWPALDAAGIPRSDVLVATVFTTGDEIARTHARSEAIRIAHPVTIEGLHLVGTDSYDGFCRLDGTVTMPQFQIGTPPFDTGGVFQLDGNDVPIAQTTMTVPVVITLPKGAMPAAGWPLYQFFHGSGGLSSGLVDLGPSPDSSDDPIPGFGPGYVVALHGLAAASSALPLNPERYPNASDYEYLNINNLASFPSTFVQGIFEQRLLLDALLALAIPQATLAGCSTISTSTGTYSFDPTELVAGGQSMGGMYTNVITAVEPRYGAIVPTGAGGFWPLMILETAIIPGARQLLGAALGLDDASMTFMHPAMNMISLAWEPGEPVASMSRIAHRPLPGFPVRHVYEPVGQGDSYFPTDVYDAAALAYGNEEAGDVVWTTMQDALELDGLGGLLGLPVQGNRDDYTRVVVQFTGDGIIDPHYIYRQLDTVKHQYGCFLESYLRDGVPTVPDLGGLTDPCP